MLRHAIAVLVDEDAYVVLGIPLVADEAGSVAESDLGVRHVDNGADHQWGALLLEVATPTQPQTRWPRREPERAAAPCPAKSRSAYWTAAPSAYLSRFRGSHTLHAVTPLYISPGSTR